jgi:hypothetical protein
MRPGLRGGYLTSVLSIGIVLSVGFVASAVAPEIFAEGASQAAAAGQEALSQNPSRQQADYAAAAEAFRNGIAREPGSAAAWMQWADFALERFRILDLELRSTQSGMAVVLRFEAQGWHSGPETREELLRQKLGELAADLRREVEEPSGGSGGDRPAEKPFGGGK